MKDFLLQLLQAVIIAAVPTVTVYLCSFLHMQQFYLKVLRYFQYVKGTLMCLLLQAA